MFPNRKMNALILSVSLTGAGVAAGSGIASAAVCGFTGITSGNLGGGDDGHYEEGNYLNCRPINDKIRVDYTYFSEERCASPGNTHLSANPNYGALTGAVRVGDR